MRSWILWLSVATLGLLLPGCSADDDPAATPDALPIEDVSERRGEEDTPEVAADTVAADSGTETDASEPDPIPLALESWCPAGAVAVEARLDELISTMTLDEKVGMMAGTEAFPADGIYPVGAVPRVGLPGLRMVDGPRGVSKNTGNATAFPVAMARAATWDPALERRVGGVMAIETAARGANVLLAPTINVLRHPRWGRAQETYGEDPVLLGAMGVAFVRGVQENGVMASVKHFAANSIEDTRFDVDVVLDERTLRELYLPHFEAVVREAHVASVMTSYNSVNGAYCSENAPLLSILKDEWEFPGFVESDWIFGTHDTVKAANAGLDIEMPVPGIYGPALISAVNDGSVDVTVVDAAARRIARAQLCYRLDTQPPVPDEAQLETTEHRALAREVATRAMVLLRNQDGVLPLSMDATVAVVGPFAAVPNLGDTGSSDVTSTNPATVYDGLVALLGDERVLLVDDLEADGVQASLATVDAVIAAVGLSADDEGESLLSAGDREGMALPAEQLELLASLQQLSVPVVAAVHGGSAVTSADAWAGTDAVMMVWYPGAEGGHAIADVLFGVEAPYGRLPLTIPADEADLPEFDNVSLQVTYDYWHGYRHLDREGTTAQFPLGFGLTYSTLSYDQIAVSAPQVSDGDVVTVSVMVTNTGARDVNALVQLYSSGGTEVQRAVKDLRGFGRADVPAGESVMVDIVVEAADIARYWSADGWALERGIYTLRAGPDASSLPLTTTLEVTE